MNVFFSVQTQHMKRALARNGICAHLGNGSKDRRGLLYLETASHATGIQEDNALIRAIPWCMGLKDCFCIRLLASTEKFKDAWFNLLGSQYQNRMGGLCQTRQATNTEQADDE